MQRDINRPTLSERGWSWHVICEMTKERFHLTFFHYRSILETSILWLLKPGPDNFTLKAEYVKTQFV